MNKAASKSIQCANSARFEAEWLLVQGGDDGGDHDVDLDQYGRSYHATKEAAEAAVIENSKRAAQCEWIAVCEQVLKGREWVPNRRWSGDWDGLYPDSIQYYESEA